MPRTKVPHGFGGNKRTRDDGDELDEIIRDFQIETENSIQMLKSELRRALTEVDAKFEDIKRSLSLEELTMKMSNFGQLKASNSAIDKKMKNLRTDVESSVQEVDKCYQEEEKTSKMMASGTTSRDEMKNDSSPVQPCQLLRRSKSASSMIPMLRVNSNERLPLKVQHSIAKYRAPINKMRTKALSADRINTITPKVDLMLPVSIMRHPREGEPVFSLMGSPIVPTSVSGSAANINIPLIGGILSIRAENINPGNLDPSLMKQIDHETFRHLRILQENLGIVMESGEYKHKLKN